jgi:serine/threonine protein kinase
MRMLNHPNIVKLLEVIYSEETLLILMEYLSGGDVFSHWRPKPDLRGEACCAKPPGEW